ncbi:MAG TPA: SDR family oxidoreductase [Roseiarcus sp.]|nr:SDR family oxidoreductase [Roseiarcus sp.]
MKLFVFGLGYSASHFVSGLTAVDVAGTKRAPQKAPEAGVEILAFDGARADAAIARRLDESDTLLVSVPPDDNGDPVMRCFRERLAASRWRAIVYLSTIGVYGDHGGAWVDERSAARTTSPRGRARLKAENAWRDFGRSVDAPVHILRLAGIYGPGRNMLAKLRRGEAQRIVKPEQVFNRIHVADIAQAIGLTIEAKGQGDVWNVADDEPAPPQDVVAFAADLLGLPAPPEVDFERAEMSAAARSFYGDNRRVSNAKLKRELGFRPLYPTYREGLRALAASGEAGSGLL